MSAMHSKFSDCSSLDDAQNSRTSSEVTAAGKGFMLFGVRLMMEEGSFRKSASMNNLAQYDPQPRNEISAGYASDDVVHPSGKSRERKRGVPWSEDEHRLFLMGLQKVGKGDWRGISRKYVKTRTPTQVASHAQKYFLRRNNHNRRRQRSSLFDITTDAVVGSPIEDQETSSHPPIIPRQKLNKNTMFHMSTYPVAVPSIVKTPKPIRPIAILPSKMANLSLNLEPPSSSLNMTDEEPRPSEQRHASAFQAMPASFKGSGGESIISVA